MHEHQKPNQKTLQKSEASSSAGWKHREIAKNATPTFEWIHEPEAAELLAIKQNTLRAMRRDGRLIPGDHYIFATGTAGGPVVYNVNAIRESLAERTVEMVQQEAKRREAEKQARQQMVETYDEARVTRS